MPHIKCASRQTHTLIQTDDAAAGPWSGTRYDGQSFISDVLETGERWNHFNRVTVVCRQSLKPRLLTLNRRDGRNSFLTQRMLIIAASGNHVTSRR